MISSLQIKLPPEVLCSIPGCTLQYLRCGSHRRRLTLTITSPSRDAGAKKSAPPSCERMAEMNRSESAMWWANAQWAATERDNTG